MCCIEGMITDKSFSYNKRKCNCFLFSFRKKFRKFLGKTVEKIKLVADEVARQGKTRTWWLQDFCYTISSEKVITKG